MKNNSTALVGSIAYVARQRDMSDADAMAMASRVVAVDTSGSMSWFSDAGEARNESRYAVACRELEKIQRERQGEVVVMSWANEALWDFDGTPTNQNGGTDIMAALDGFLEAGLDGLLALTIISDGGGGDISKKDQSEAIKTVMKMASRVDTIFIGNIESEDAKEGAAFLKRLAKAGRGTTATTLEPGMLAKPVLLMLGAPADPNAGVINL